MQKRTHSAALAIALTLVAACGGSESEPAADDTPADDVAETNAATTTQLDATTTDPPVTEPPATEAPTTEAPTTNPPPVTEPSEPALPDWASGAMTTVDSDTGPLELPVELVPFCESSRSFYIAAKGLDFVAEGQTGTAQQLFAAMAALVPVTIETAPSSEFAAEPMKAQAQLAIIIPAFEEIGYDSSRANEFSDAEAVLGALQGFTETRTELQRFLVEVCGADADVMDGQSLDAVVIAAGAVGETIEPEEPVEAVPGSMITNSDGSIEVSVPDDWTDIDEGGDDVQSTLTAAPDIAAFETLDAPGVQVLRGVGGFRDGGFVGRVLSAEFRLQEAGCTLVDERNYSDGVYSGQERVYDCGNDELDVRLFGGTTDDEALYAMVQLVQPADEPGVRQLVADTFFVS